MNHLFFQSNLRCMIGEMSFYRTVPYLQRASDKNVEPWIWAHQEGKVVSQVGGLKKEQSEVHWCSSVGWTIRNHLSDQLSDHCNHQWCCFTASSNPVRELLEGTQHSGNAYRTAMSLCPLLFLDLPSQPLSYHHDLFPLGLLTQHTYLLSCLLPLISILGFWAMLLPCGSTEHM